MHASLVSHAVSKLLHAAVYMGDAGGCRAPAAAAAQHQRRVAALVHAGITEAAGSALLAALAQQAQAQGRWERPGAMHPSMALEPSTASKRQHAHITCAC